MVETSQEKKPKMFAINLLRIIAGLSILSGVFCVVPGLLMFIGGNPRHNDIESYTIGIASLAFGAVLLAISEIAYQLQRQVTIKKMLHQARLQESANAKTPTLEQDD